MPSPLVGARLLAFVAIIVSAFATLASAAGAEAGSAPIPPTLCDPALSPGPRDRTSEPGPRDRILEPGTRDWLKAMESGRVRPTELRTDNCPHDYDVLHYRLELAIDFSAQTIAGTTAIRCVVEQDLLDHLDLDLTALTVDGVVMDGQPLGFAHTDPLLRIDLGGPHTAGDTLEVSVTYHGRPANEGPGGFGGFYFNTSAGIAYQMAVGLVADPPSMGKCWFPCWDWPCDKATAEYHITVPDGKIAVCNGALLGSRRDEGTRSVTWSWSETHQISPHVMSVAACGYSELVDPTYPWIRYWVYPSQVNAAQTHFSNVHTMMDAFISRYGPYPFDKFGYAAAPKGDMEHQTCVTHLAGLIQANHVYDWLLAHELAHQWWGDCVSINDWRDIWLSEGFATYSEAIFQEYAYGAAAYRTYMQNSLMTPVLNSSENFPIYDPDYLWGTTVYEKGGCVLHMLRGVVGDAGFFDALAAYRAAHEHGNAVTTQFQEIVETTCGQDLDWFFQEWIYDVGWPEYRYAWIGQPDGGAWQLLLSIDQTQTNGPVFTMPLEVKVTTAAGDAVFDLWVDEAHEYFTLPLAARPTAVVLDPDNWILNRATEVAASSADELGSPLRGVASAPAIGPLRVAPNPLAAATQIRFALVRSGPVRAEIFDPAGRFVARLADESCAAGEVVLAWDGRGADGRRCPPGAYLLRVRAAGATATEKLLLVR